MKTMRHATSDFTEDMLPSTRREAFADCLKIRFGKLVKIGLIALAFSLPLFILAVLRDTGTAAIYAEYENGAIELKKAQSLVFWADNFYGLAGVLAYAVLFIGVSGCQGVIKRIGWIEPVFFGADFREGLKDNWLRYAILGLIFGLFKYLCDMSLKLSSSKILSILPSGVLIVVFVPVVLLVFEQSCVYNLRFSESLKNALLLYFKTFPKTLLATAVALCPLLAAMIGNLLVKYLLLAFAAAFLSPAIMLGWFLYGCYVFDGCINKDNFPDLYKRGLFAVEEKSDKGRENAEKR